MAANWTAITTRLATFFRLGSSPRLYGVVEAPRFSDGVLHALIDPRNQEIRYIGITNHPERRWTAHDGNGDENNIRKQQWVAELKSTGLRPVMKALEVVPSLEDARTREAMWINVCANVGMELLNVALRPRQLPLPAPQPISPAPSEEGKRRMREQVEEAKALAEQEKVLQTWRDHPEAKPYEICGLAGISNNKWRWVQQVIEEEEARAAAQESDA